MKNIIRFLFDHSTDVWIAIIFGAMFLWIMPALFYSFGAISHFGHYYAWLFGIVAGVAAIIFLCVKASPLLDKLRAWAFSGDEETKIDEEKGEKHVED